MTAIAFRPVSERTRMLDCDAFRDLMGFPVHFVTESPNCAHHSLPRPLDARLDGGKWVVPAEAVELAHG